MSALALPDGRSIADATVTAVRNNPGITRASLCWHVYPHSHVGGYHRAIREALGCLIVDGVVYRMGKYPQARHYLTRSVTK